MMIRQVSTLTCHGHGGTLSSVSSSSLILSGNALSRLPVCRPVRCMNKRGGNRGMAMIRSAMAGSSASGDDPHTVLGLPKNADYNAIQRAYRKLTAENRGNDEVLQRIEAAHSSLMMSALSARMQGGVEVDKDVLYADRAKFFPWRPRLYFSGKKIMLYAGLAQMLLLAWALITPTTAGTQPVVWSAIAAAVANIYKQNQIFPPPVRGMEMSDEERKQGGKNILRGAFLAFLGTFGGCFLFYTAPDAVASAIGRVLPLWFYEGQSILLAIGACICNWVVVTLFR